MRLIWSPLAVTRMKQIVEYISLDDPKAAQNWANNVFAKTDALETSPKMGRVVPEINRSNLRELIYGNYRIIYQISKESIDILTVRNARQEFLASEVE